MKLQKKLINFDISFLRKYKNCEKFTNRKDLTEENKDICLVEDVSPLNQLLNLDILNKDEYCYFYNDNLIKFFCQNF